MCVTLHASHSGKLQIDHGPSNMFKENIIRAEHSPLRELRFGIRMYDIPYWVAMRFTRHVFTVKVKSLQQKD